MSPKDHRVSYLAAGRGRGIAGLRDFRTDPDAFSLTRSAGPQSRRSCRKAPRGFSHRAVIAVSQATAVLLSLAMLMFAATTLPAQGPAPTQLQEFNVMVHQASGFETYRLPAITFIVGRAGLIGQTGRQATTIEMAVAVGAAYVVLGGVLFALVASFRLLSDKVDSFFSLLIPEPAAIRGMRKIPPPDEDFSPFKFDQRPSRVRNRKPDA
jgi:hypothetical protein